MSDIIMLDTRRLKSALLDVLRDAKKIEADVVNKAAKDIAFRAMGQTGFASPGQIEGELLTDKLAIRIVASRLRKKGNFTKAQLASGVRKLINARKRGSRFRRVGWIPAIKALGGSPRGERVRSGGMASRGYAKPATVSDLTALIANVSYDAMTGPNAARSQAQMINALKAAVAIVAKDREEYARKKMDAMLSRHR